MNAAAGFVRKGWCPGLHRPMQAADGWLLRVRPHRATLSAPAARALAQAARGFADGRLSLTQRGGLQLRGVATADLPRVADALRDAGLAADAQAEQRDRLIIPPLLGADPGMAPGSADLVAALEAALRASTKLDHLPDKFTILVDGGGALGLGDVAADLRIVAAPDGWALGLAGSFARASCADPAAAMLAIARNIPPGQRMRDVVAAHGAASVFAQAGLRIDGHAMPANPPAPVGFFPPGVLGIGLVFGDITADALAALAGLAEHQGDATLRVTPWRALLLPGIGAAQAPSAMALAAGLGLIIDPADPRRRVFACIGAPGCASALAPTRDLAAQLVGQFPGILHVSGCAKGCAHPARADATLVGTPHGFRLVRDGTARDLPTGGAA